MTESMAERMSKAESKPFAASEGIATSEKKLRAESKPFVTSKSTSDPSIASNGVTSTSTQVESMAPDQVVPAGSDGLNQDQVVPAQVQFSSLGPFTADTSPELESLPPLCHLKQTQFDSNLREGTTISHMLMVTSLSNLILPAVCLNQPTPV